jgi:hypothetical protein
MRRSSFFCAAEFSIGLAYSSAHLIGISLAVLMPAFAMRQQSRSQAYRGGICYYAGALWPLIPGARNFFGSAVSPLTAIALWTVASLLLASPWPLVWSAERRQWWWRAACGLTLTALPPLAIIGWASPLTGAGYLFPGTSWFGLAACVLAPGLLAAYPSRAMPLYCAAVILFNIVRTPVSAPPPGWIGVDTHFGAIAHGRVKPLSEYSAAQQIQKTADSIDGKVVLFPETVVPTWTPSTDAFWQPTLEALRASGKSVIVGARIPIREAGGRPNSIGDFAAALAVLRGAALPVRPDRTRSAEFQYDNAVVVRGSESAVLGQRIPVPIAMWKPFQRTGARLHLFSSGIISVAGRRVGVLICYEQLLTWPVMTSMLHRPDILFAVANDHWVQGTPIPADQRCAVISWSRLFRVPYLSATNF